MAPCIGGVTHDPINVRLWTELARTAHRRRWRPWLTAPMVSVQVPCEFLYFGVLQRMCLGNIAVCPVEFPPPPKARVSVFNLDSSLICFSTLGCMQSNRQQWSSLTEAAVGWSRRYSANCCRWQQHDPKIEYFGTYIWYLPTNPPRYLIVTPFQLIPDHTQLDPRFQMTPNTAELACFFLETF